MAVAAIPLGLFMLWFKSYLVAPADWGSFALFLISIILTALLQFFISYSMAMLAFWVMEVSTFIFILFAFEYIASGHMFPLDILPPALQTALAFTPFPYQMYFPVSIYMGRATDLSVVQGLLVQAGWVLAAFGLACWTWRRGLHHYAAVGG
jgi:ABC-2 type transport system permease protein